MQLPARAIALALVATVGVSCAQSAPKRSPRPRPSGFLGDYQRFRVDPSRNGALVYRQAGTNLSAYDRILIEPIVFWPENAAGQLDAADREHLTRYFQNAMEKAVSGVYPLARQPGPGVLRVRTALTGAAPTRRDQVQVSAQSADRYDSGASQIRRSQGWATVEAELVDSESGERKLGVVARRDVSAPISSLSKWGDVEKLLDQWARNLRLELDSAKP
ncbi:MAG: DUF3313 domain-containing protein [Myxococcota bacterium]